MKLYWRYKKDGKWTWKAAVTRIPLEEIPDDELDFIGIVPFMEEEE